MLNKPNNRKHNVCVFEKKKKKKKTGFDLKMQGSCVFLGENINIYATSLWQKVYYSSLQEIILESDDCLGY